MLIMSEIEECTPLASVIQVDNQDNIPVAIQIFNTKKLYRRWAKCCSITLDIAKIGFEHADNMQTEATIWGTIGLLFGSKNMQQSAAETHKQAHETRKTTIYFAFVFLLVSAAVTSIYWAVEEGVVGLITKSISAFVSGCCNALSATGSWIKSKIIRMFKRNNTENQDMINATDHFEKNQNIFTSRSVENLDSASVNERDTQPTILHK